MESEDKSRLGSDMESEVIKSDFVAVRSNGPCPYSIDGLLGLRTSSKDKNAKQDGERSFQNGVSPEKAMGQTDLASDLQGIKIHNATLL